jgi:hypothetical protein
LQKIEQPGMYILFSTVIRKIGKRIFGKTLFLEISENWDKSEKRLGSIEKTILMRNRNIGKKGGKFGKTLLVVLDEYSIQTRIQIQYV